MSPTAGSRPSFPDILTALQQMRAEAGEAEGAEHGGALTAEACQHEGASGPPSCSSTCSATSTSSGGSRSLDAPSMPELQLPEQELPTLLPLRQQAPLKGDGGTAAGRASPGGSGAVLRE